jgi:hypothetical protein
MDDSNFFRCDFIQWQANSFATIKCDRMKVRRLRLQQVNDGLLNNLRMFAWNVRNQRLFADAFSQRHQKPFLTFTDDSISLPVTYTYFFIDNRWPFFY